MDKEVILDTVKKMFSSGIDEDTIRATLKDIGLVDAQIDEVLEEARGIPKVEKRVEIAERIKAAEETEREKETIAPAFEKPKTILERPFPEKPFEGVKLHEEIAAKTAEKIKEHLEESTEEIGRTGAELGVLAEEQRAALEEHKERLAGVEGKVDELHKKLEVFPEKLEESSLMAKDAISQIQSDITSLKAMNQALQSILQKILDTNREILLELQRKVS